MHKLLLILLFLGSSVYGMERTPPLNPGIISLRPTQRKQQGYRPKAGTTPKKSNAKPVQKIKEPQKLTFVQICLLLYLRYPPIKTYSRSTLLEIGAVVRTMPMTQQVAQAAAIIKEGTTKTLFDAYMRSKHRKQQEECRGANDAQERAWDRPLYPQTEPNKDWQQEELVKEEEEGWIRAEEFIRQLIGS